MILLRRRSRTAPAGAPAPRVIRQETVITQSLAELVIERRYDDEVVERSVYKLDGSESVNATRTTTNKSTTVWKGSALISTGTLHVDLSDGFARDAKGQPLAAIDRAFVTTRTLRPDGTMVVESRTTQNGEERLSWSVFVRVTQPSSDRR